MTGRVRRLALLFLLPVALAVWAPPARAHGPGQEFRVLVFWADRVSFEGLLADRDVAALARAGGAGLLTSPSTVRPLVGEILEESGGPIGADDVVLAAMAAGSPSGPVVLGARIRQIVEATPGHLLVIVATPTPSKAMEAANDRVGGIVVASGHPDELFPSTGEERALTSGSTQREGIVAAVDVPATILDYMGWPLPEVGSPIRATEAPAPFELHERHLANMRIWVPVQLGAGIYFVVAGLGCLALLLLRSRVPRSALSFASWVPLSVAPLGAALLAAGDLPSLSAAWVVPFLVVVPVVAVAAAAALRHSGGAAPAAAIGAAVLVYVTLEAAAGFPAALTPFLGGTQLDGARFYGLPNAFIGLLLGSSVFVAMRLRTWAGFALICATGLLAGLPLLGANHGAALTLFAGAGLWLVLRLRGRLGWRELGLAALVVGAGMAVVVLAHAFSPTPTHGTRFVQSLRGPSDLLQKLGDRLAIGLRLMARSPLTALPVLGVPVCLYFLLRPRGALRDALERHPEWRDALLVILLASVVAYLGNDTGPAAAGLGFGMALGGMLHVSLAGASWKMER